MPPIPRPQSHFHKLNETLPYNRPPSSSSSTSTKPKSKGSPRPDTPPTNSHDIGAVVHVSDKKARRNKRKKSRHSEMTASVKEELVAGLSRKATSPQPHISAHVEDKEAVLACFMKLTAPRPGEARPVLTPSTNKKGESPTQRPNSVKPSPPMTKEDGKVQMLQKQLAVAKEGAERIAAETKDTIESLEKEIEAAKTQLAEQDKVIEEGTKMKEALKEAVGCGVCFETLRDPHILSCGHIACKECLVSWFRTPGAYVHEIHEDLTPELNTSYRSKVCHVCRSIIVRRPARVYHLRAILEPLGIDSELPTASQEDLERDDPWRNIFPTEKTAYRLHDEIDGVSRCPECFGEIEEGMCVACAIEFSETEGDGDEGDWESEDGSLGSILDGEEVLSDLEGLEEEERRFRRRVPHAMGFAHRMPVLNRRRDAARPVRPLPPRASQPGLHQLLDDMANESDGFAGEHDYPDAEESDPDDSDDDYGGSFIDDGELSAGTQDGEGQEDNGSDEMEVDADVVQSEKEDGDSEEDDPPIEELRRRRVQRHGPIPASVVEEGRDSPVVRRGRRRQRPVVDLNSDEE